MTAAVIVNAARVPGVVVTFRVVGGPNAGVTGSATTNAMGIASFSYLGLTPGVDLIEASYPDSHGVRQTSKRVEKSWYAKPRLDHYECYGLDQTESGFVRKNVFLRDRFHPMRQASVAAPRVLCDPVRKRRLDTGELDPSPNWLGHLVCHPVLAIPAVPTPRHVVAVDQFGSRVLTLGASDELCLPSSARKPPGPVSPPPAGLSHYQCYRATAGPAGSIPVSLNDSFMGWVTRAKVLHPTVLCTPTSKRWLREPWTPVPLRADHLVCYPLGGASVEPRFAATPVRFRNQFDATKPRSGVVVTLRRLCAPAVKIPLD